jgi:hypothetical protein
MADPGGALEARGAVAVTGTVAASDPEALLAQIEHTRADLARTIDQLADRVSPASNIRMLRDRASSELSRPQVRVGMAVGGAALLGLVALRLLSRRRR